VPLAEAGAQVSEVDAADDGCRTPEPGGGKREQVRIEVRRVDDPDVLLADEGRDPCDLLEGSRAQHRAAEREEMRLVAERARLLEHRAGQLDAAHHRLEPRGVPSQSLDALPLRAAEPEAVDAVENAQSHSSPRWGRPERPASP